MFTRARLRIAGLYVVLLSLIVVLVAGSLVLLAARDARRTVDLELRLRAEGLAAEVQRGRTSTSVAPSRDAEHEDDEDEESEHRGRELERAGFLTYVLPVVGGDLELVASGGIAGLPDIDAARDAQAARRGRYTTRSLADGRVRLYSLPAGQPPEEAVAVVQVVRSQTFVDATVRRLLLGLLLSALVGTVGAALAGYWLAGRTLRPIAAAMQRQRDFVADASHELRTPLTAIRGNVEHVRRYPDEPVRAFDDAMEDIANETERLGRLVSGLLMLARADEGRVELHRSTVNLSALIGKLAQDMAPLADARGLELHTAIEPAITVYGDADRLRELGLILLDNAILYTTAGRVAVSVDATATWATLRVEDTGPGIAAEHLPRVFDRFYRTPAARASETGGTGLGLAIARWIAEAHGGRIAGTSEVGRGSTFIARLPRHTPRNTADATDGVGG
jgi:two-component system, OmpR family, sensor histidine kinase CiaH